MGLKATCVKMFYQGHLSHQNPNPPAHHIPMPGPSSWVPSHHGESLEPSTPDPRSWNWCCLKWCVIFTKLRMWWKKEYQLSIVNHDFQFTLWMCSNHLLPLSPKQALGEAFFCLASAYSFCIFSSSSSTSYAREAVMKQWMMAGHLTLRRKKLY